MIKLNDNEVVVKYFSDGALDIKIEPGLLKYNQKNIVSWFFDNNEELIIVYFLVSHLHSKDIKDVDLYMPYIPNARKDRAQREKDVFSLKYFSNIINSLNLNNVYVLDPHSIVSEALINNIRIITPEKLILGVLDKIGDNVMMFYPDEGAMKRYSDKIDKEYVYGMKVRDKETRAITSLKIEGDVESIKGKDILMVDDICASGNTLAIAARHLKQLSAANIYVYVSHLENTILNGELINEVDKIYTTDSIFRNKHPKIEVKNI